MMTNSEIKPFEFAKQYQPFIFKKWVTYLYLLFFGDFAIHRFYLGDKTSRKIAIYFLVARALVAIFLAMFDVQIKTIILYDIIIVYCLLLYDFLNIYEKVDENNNYLRENIKLLEDISFKNRQLLWNYSVLVAILIRIFYFINSAGSQSFISIILQK